VVREPRVSKLTLVDALRKILIRGASLPNWTDQKPNPARPDPRFGPTPRAPVRTLIEIALPAQLNGLVRYCEKVCVAGCCGIDAFDFSPLHVASYISGTTGCISADDIAEWEQELAKAEELARDLAPNENGYICSIAGMNQCFRRDAFRSFIGELRHSLQVSPKIMELSEDLRTARSQDDPAMS
jgi:hypothetical protein